MTKKLTSRIILGIFVSGAIVSLFQNCAPQFKVQESVSDLTSTQNFSLSCALQDGTNVSPGQSIQGYAMMSALYPITCGSKVTRTCLSSGQFDGSVPLYSSCNQQCVHPDNSQAVSSGSTYVYYTKSSGVSQADCDSAKVTTTCSASTGTFSPAVPTQRYASCLVQGQVCAYTSSTGTATPTGNMTGNTVTGYALQSATYPTLCGSTVTRTCQSNGSWGGTVPLYTTCAQKCLHPDTSQPVGLATQYVYYTLAEGSATQCAAAKVTATCQSTGLFSPNPSSVTTKYSVCKEYPLPTIASFTATPNTIQSGEMATLTWSTSNATTLTVTPGNLAVTGMANVSVSPTATTTYTLTATNPAGSVTATVQVAINTAAPLLGQALYTNKCSACHGAFEVSNLKGRTVTSDIINTAINTKVSSMATLKNTMTSDQIASLAALFTTTPVGQATTSSFTCASTESEKNSSAELIRLTGTELKNSYVAVLPTAVWSALSAQYYLIPTDQLDGLISNFVKTFTPDTTDQMSRFNEHVANQVVASSANISAFFGTCATTSSFAKTCFDSFLTAKGPYIFRSALASDDNTRIWSAISGIASVTDQYKALVQIMFNDPRFLYHLELGEGTADANGILALTSYEIANRISYGMTAAPPDSTLWAAAVANSLKSATAIAAQVDRIAATTAYKNRVIDFVKFYVGVENPGIAPQHTEFMNGLDGTNLNVAATDEFKEYVNYVIFTKGGTLKDLFTSNAAFPKTSAMATILGTSVWSSGNPMTAPNHAGILTRPYLQLVSAPNLKLVQRGKRIRINMLCSDVPQPSAADLAARPTLSEADLINLNRRSYIDKATLSASSCVVCHSKMNQLGYATENYDSVGRYITTERIYNASDVKVATHPVVSSSTPTITENDTRTFANVTEFQTELSKSDTLQQCLTRKAYQFFQRKEDVVAQDGCRLNKMDTLLKTDMPLNNFILENFKQTSMMYKRSN